MRHLTALLPALLAALPASGETPPPPGSLRVAASADLLSYPDPQSPAVTRLAAATGGLEASACVTPEVGDEVLWCLVDSPAGPGWVRAGALLAGDGTAAGPDGPGAHLPEGARVIVAHVDSRLNLRAGPGTGQGIAARVTPGTVLERGDCVEGPAHDWCAVSDAAGKELGWAAAEFLDPADSRALAAAGTFDRIGHLPCRGPGASGEVRCAYGTAGDGTGRVTVTVFLPEGGTRMLDFHGGAFLLADPDLARAGDIRLEPGPETTLIALGDAQFEIPAAILAPAEARP